MKKIEFSQEQSLFIKEIFLNTEYGGKNKIEQQFSEKFFTCSYKTLKQHFDVVYQTEKLMLNENLEINKKKKS